MAFPNTLYLTPAQVLTESATNTIPLGTRAILADGRVFRRAKNAATALKVGMGIHSAALGEMACVNTSAGGEFPAGTTIGTTWNRFTLGGSFYSVDLDANAYAEGWLLVGSTQYYSAQMLKIKSHGAVTAGTSGSHVDAPSTFILEDGYYPVEAINTSQGFGLLKNPYDSVVVMTTNSAMTRAIIGITPIAVTASYYFWAQTWGLAMIKMADASTSVTMLGRPVSISPAANTTGFCTYSSSAAAVTEGSWTQFAVLHSGCTAGGYATANIMIAP